ncbi:MAG: ABC transporter substrate-binding protein [Pseudomonadota bacterium]
MKKIKFGWIMVMVILTGIFSISAAGAEVGVTDNSIKIGTVVDTTGPLTFFGTSIKASIEAYFKEINAKGGVHGRKLELVQESDNYEPAKSVAALKKLIVKDGVFCFVSNMGTPGVKAQIPTLQDEGIPLVGPTAAGEFLNEPPKKYIFPVLMNYELAGISMVRFIFENLKVSDPKIGFIGSDRLGPLVEVGVEKEVKKYRASLKTKVSFPSKEVDFSSHVLKLKSADIDHVIIVGIYGESAKILSEMHKIGWKPTVIVNASSADPKLLELSGSAGEGAIVQMNFAMFTDDAPGVKEYRELMARHAPEAKLSNFGMWGGYAAAKLLVEGLNRAGKDLTREKLVSALESISGFKTDILPPINFGPNKRAGAPGAVYTKIEGGKFKKLTDWIMID